MTYADEIAVRSRENTSAGGEPIDGRALWERSLEAERLPDSRLDGTLITTTRSGDRVTLGLHLVGRLDDNGVSRRLLLRVAAAGSLGGAALLTIEHPNRPADLWVYLPTVGAPRRVFGGNLGDSFLGSELRLGDLLQPDPNEWTLTVRGLDEIRGHPCWVIDAVPSNPRAERQTDLGRQVLWIGQGDSLQRRIEQYDRWGQLLKIAEVVRWMPVSGGRKWLAVERNSRNVQTGASTSAVFHHVEVGIGIPGENFTPCRLLDASW